MKLTDGSHVGADRRWIRLGQASRVKSSRARCRALFKSEDVAKAIENVSPRMTELLTNREAWTGLQPHFGSRGIAAAFDAVVARTPQVVLPSSLPLDLNITVERALQPLRSAAGELSAVTPNWKVDLTSTVPTASGSDGLQTLSHSLVQNLDAATAVATASASQATAVLAASGDLGRGLAAAGQALSEGKLPPHFGSAAVVRGVESLANWVGSRFSGVEMLDPDTAASLTSALSELRGVAGVMTLPPALGAAGSSTLQQLGASASALVAGLSSLVGRGEESMVAAAAAPDALLTSFTAMYLKAQEDGVGGHSLATVGLTAAFTLLAVVASTPGEGYPGPKHPYDGPGMDELSHEYDPDGVALYFSRRPLAVLRRSAQVAAEAASFGAALLLDLWTGRLEANEGQRAEQLRGIVERLGPAYVKVAQALSTRVDLLSPAYFQQVELLQDRVPPFPCEDARREMEKAFGGRPVEAVFSFLSEKPVAAASLGQVYKGTLRPELGGGDVAVKVQRPGVLEQVALDLLIMRRLAVRVKESLQMNTDWAAIIDAWAVRFFHELDYEREAANAATFKAQMEAAGVEGITVSDVRTNLSTDFVLTTTWVEGEKLSESTASDVRELCSTLLNAYLIQLLDTGFLHADPHPGNLIRTPDGKICVLDFGLMTEVTPEQRVALVEYIAHLSTQNWEKLAVDLQTLGFIPPHVDPRQAGLVEPLGRVMSQLVGGGGAAKVNIDKVTGDLEELGKLYPIQVPPFFALILRAFSVIEGIALRVDPNYAIVAECFPYLARRLLNDDSPRMRAVLRDMLYGGKQRMDVERLIRVADGFSTFTTDGLSGQGAAAGTVTIANAASTSLPVGSSSESRLTTTTPASMPVQAIDEAVLSPAMVDALRAVVRPGSYVSELLIEELVAAVDALSRESLSRLVRGVLLSAPAAMSLRGVEALGPLRSVLLPLPTPVELLARVAPAVAVTPEDQEALGLVRAILLLSQRLAQSEALAAAAQSPQQQQAIARGRARRAPRLANELVALLPDLAPGLAYSGDLLVRALMQRITSRMTEAVRLASGRRIVGDEAPASPLPQPAVAMRMMGMERSGVSAGGQREAVGRR